MKDFHSRVVVITGGSKGIGRAVANRFAEENARLVLVHYDADDSASLETLKQLSEKGVEAVSYRVDVSSFKEAAVRWMNEAQVYEKEGSHRAMGDIKESVAELKFYKNLFLPEG